MKSIETKITINAPVEKVWQVLMNTSNYAWNPFIREIKGEVSEDETIEVEIQQEGKKAMKFKPRVLVRKENTEFRWLGHLFVKGLFDGEHFFKLKQLENGKTEFTHGENFKGVMSGVLLKMIGEDTKKGFVAMNEALKLESEK